MHGLGSPSDSQKERGMDSGSQRERERVRARASLQGLRIVFARWAIWLLLFRAQV